MSFQHLREAHDVFLAVLWETHTGLDGEKKKTESLFGRKVKVERVDMRVQGSGRGGRGNYDLKLLYEILSKLIKVFLKGKICT